MIIVNLQITPYDDYSEIRSFSKTDKFMTALMNELNLEEFDMSFDILKKIKEENEEKEKIRKDFKRKIRK